MGSWPAARAVLPVTADVPLADPARPGEGAAPAGAAAVLDQPFDAGTLHQLRAAVLAHAAAAALPGRLAADVMLAVHELAANAVRHGTGAGRLRMSAAAGLLRCQVDDGDLGGADGPQAAADTNGQAAGGAGPGGPGPWPYRPGHGLWLVRQVAAQISVLCGAAGSRVIVTFALPAAQGPAGAA